MTCIALHCHRRVCRSRSGPGRSALRFCKVPPRGICPGQASSFLYPSLLGHREENIRLRPAAQRVSAFPDSFPKTSVGPFPIKQPAALGSSHPSRPSRLNVPSRSGERNGGFNRMYQNRISLIGFTGKTRKRVPPPRRPTPFSRWPRRAPTRTRSPASTSHTLSGTALSFGESSVSSPARSRKARICSSKASCAAANTSTRRTMT